jgi:hypothetical protein
MQGELHADGEEVQRQHLPGLGPQELGPARAAPAGAGSIPALLSIRHTVDGATRALPRRIRAARDRPPEIDDTTVNITVPLPVDPWHTLAPTAIKSI